jgi:hypothetical protein
VNRAKGGIESVHRCMDLSFGNIQRATSGQIRARIHDLSPNSAIGICNQQRDILRLRLIGLRSSGGKAFGGRAPGGLEDCLYSRGRLACPLPTETGPKIL